MKGHRHTKVMRKRCVRNLLVRKKEVQFCWRLIRSIHIYFIGQVYPAFIQRECSFLFWLILKQQPLAKTCSVETLRRENDLSCFKSLLVAGLWPKILTSLLPFLQSCSSKFGAWSCTASNFDKGVKGDHKHKIMDRPFVPKYGTVCQVLLQLVVACFSFLKGF